MDFPVPIILATYQRFTLADLDRKETMSNHLVRTQRLELFTLYEVEENQAEG